MSERIVGLDFGHKRIGIALSDTLFTFAFPIKEISAGTTPEQSAEIVWNEIQQLLISKKCALRLFVIGLPLTLKGEQKERALEVHRFSETLTKLSQKQVHLMDERLSSLCAERALKNLDFSRKKRAKFMDEVSAALVLQSYLDSMAKTV